MNEKYLAGLLDADGYVSVRVRLGATPDLEVGIAQATPYRFILEYAQSEFGGQIYESHEGAHSKLSLRSGPARKMLERLKKYMVLKRHHAERMIELVDSYSVLKTKDEVDLVRTWVKQIRLFGADRLPNFPSRKWLAGYFDGDGSFAVKLCKKTGYAYPSASILAAPNYTAGIVLLQQAFGGRICGVGQNALWQLQLSQPSKAEQFLSYFAQHLHIKKAAAYFLLGCAEHNLRDGATIRDAIKALNSQQHRLSDPTSKAAEFIRLVNFGIPARPQGRPKGAKDLKPRKPRTPQMKRQSDPLVVG